MIILILEKLLQNTQFHYKTLHRLKKCSTLFILLYGRFIEKQLNCQTQFKNAACQNYLTSLTLIKKVHSDTTMK